MNLKWMVCTILAFLQMGPGGEEDFHLLMEFPEEMSGKNLSERWPKYWWQG